MQFSSPVRRRRIGTHRVFTIYPPQPILVGLYSVKSIGRDSIPSRSMIKRIEIYLDIDNFHRWPKL